MQKSDVVVVGNIGIYTNVYFYGNEIDFSVEANFTQNLDTVGQAGGYASRGYAQLGYKTAFLGCVGDDYSGDYLQRVLAADGINMDGIFIDPDGTSRSVNLMYPDGRRKNFYNGKGHMQLQAPIEKARELFSGAKLAHFNIPNWARDLLPIAKSCGLTIACDIQDVVRVDDGYRTDFVKQADILFFSAANHADPVSLIEKYLELNPELIVLSGMGERGCAFGNRHGIAYYPALELDLPVLDTNGAGDALAVGFLTSFVLDSRGVEESITRGLISARYKCSQKANSDHMITRSLLEYYSNELP